MMNLFATILFEYSEPPSLWLRIHENVNCGWRNEYKSDPRCYENYLTSSENKAWKKVRAVRIWKHDLCNTGAVLHQLS